ncbi:MAG: hypothetical protein UV73_C0018G0017 [Candidatus Gottesmanbacteria bacterium GW2011_GWA2_43_14]|uniref:Uncharacterized protein n=1 Tax=Candidatus Gottesmanbacteria bacterium GW2011_GWA2_43_14 TaxID=1618443 RepID=A0A0G1DCH1_9BACT|nr:MAG: hypothetical protein UV73_C0018G0017 [Candidatus Gottesmanbacteria bacterium GW2011_GWA2_43_14]
MPYMDKPVNLLAGEKLQKQLSLLTPHARRDVESWVVNTVKIKVLKKFEEYLELDGLKNLRMLLLAPVFTIKELTDRVKEQAPEIATLYFKELFQAMDEVEGKLSP